MKQERKFYMVKSQKLAGYLMMRGFVLINMSPDTSGSGRNVFWFNATDKLYFYIEKYFEEIANERISNERSNERIKKTIR